jgi:hypothetical protein
MLASVDSNLQFQSSRQLHTGSQQEQHCTTVVTMRSIPDPLLFLCLGPLGTWQPTLQEWTHGAPEGMELAW